MLATTERYLGLMERALAPYRWEEVLARRTSTGDRLDLHAYSRIACVAAGLFAAGRLPAPMEQVCAVVTSCCDELATGRRVSAADFAVKEVLLAVQLLEPVTGQDLVRAWDTRLARVDPSRTYTEVLTEGEDPSRLHNINIYVMVGEYLRQRRGLTRTEALFDRHWPHQLRRFDADGRYRDPGHPMLYDVAARVQVQHLLHSGYQGRYAAELDAQLRRGGLASLRTQSVSGEFPFGGRSSQFLFNEVLHAASCEYEARRWAVQGAESLAGQFRSSALMALDALDRWLRVQPPRSIKNLFEPHSKHGTEGYGTYEKYMISVGSFAALALLFTDGAAAETPAPAARGGYVVTTSDDFHQVVATAAGYTVQIDTAANQRYDATGLGRVHRRGVPTELGLSVALPGGDGYTLTGSDRRAAAIGPAWRTTGGQVHRLAAISEVESVLEIREESPGVVAFDLCYSSDRLGLLRQSYRLDASGVAITATWLSAPPEMHQWWLEVPVLQSNGRDQAAHRSGTGGLDVMLAGHRYRIRSDQTPVLGSEVLGNRNGTYRLARVRADGDVLSIHLSLGS